MRDAKDTPDDDVLIDDAFPTLHCVRHAINLSLALERVPPTGIQLAVAVLGHPDMMLREPCPACLDGIWVREEKLRWQRRELVSDGSPADGVLGRGVDDLDDAVEVWCSIEP